MHLLRAHLAHSARIVFVSSITAWSALPWRLMPLNSKRILWELLPQRQHAHLALSDSKLAGICHARHLRYRLSGKAQVIILDPGLVHTSLSRLRDEDFYVNERYRSVHDERYFWWQASVGQVGSFMRDAAFVKPGHNPEMISAWFLPGALLRWTSDASWGTWRRYVVAWFTKTQWFTYGQLHRSAAPVCYFPYQKRLWNWSLHAVQEQDGTY